MSSLCLGMAEVSASGAAWLRQQCGFWYAGFATPVVTAFSESVDAREPLLIEGSHLAHASLKVCAHGSLWCPCLSAMLAIFFKALPIGEVNMHPGNIPLCAAHLNRPARVRGVPLAV